MGFSPKRLKAFKDGKVSFCIYSGNECVYTTSNFIQAVQMADSLQKANPGIPYTMKLEEVNNG